MPFSLIVAETDILPINVPVARFQLLDQFALGITPAAQQLRRSDIESQCAEQQLSQLHYYPNQRSVCPVKQIIIRD